MSTSKGRGEREIDVLILIHGVQHRRRWRLRDHAAAIGDPRVDRIAMLRRQQWKIDAVRKWQRVHGGLPLHDGHVAPLRLRDVEHADRDHGGGWERERRLGEQPPDHGPAHRGAKLHGHRHEPAGPAVAHEQRHAAEAIHAPRDLVAEVEEPIADEAHLEALHRDDHVADLEPRALPHAARIDAHDLHAGGRVAHVDPQRVARGLGDRRRQVAGSADESRIIVAHARLLGRSRRGRHQHRSTHRHP
jgi:hypothetical protein